MKASPFNTHTHTSPHQHHRRRRRRHRHHRHHRRHRRHRHRSNEHRAELSLSKGSHRAGGAAVASRLDHNLADPRVGVTEVLAAAEHHGGAASDDVVWIPSGATRGMATRGGSGSIFPLFSPIGWSTGRHLDPVTVPQQRCGCRWGEQCGQPGAP